MSSKPTDPKQPYWKTYLKPFDEKELTASKTDVHTQMVVYRSDPDDNKFDEWIRLLEEKIEAIQTPDKTIRIGRICGNCNSSLLLLGGEGVEAFVTTEGAVRGSGSGEDPGSTGIPGIYRSTNFRIDIPEKLYKPKTVKINKPEEQSSRSMKETVNVAVLDTGMDTDEFSQYIIEPNNDPCIPTAVQGWNFANENTTLTDNHPNQHGNTVTALLIAQSLETEDGNPVKLTPVKVQDEKGISNLYDVLCALAYAKSMGAQIINASFGYYAPVEYHINNTFCVEIFRVFIKDVLTKDGILLIAAAGNAQTEDVVQELFDGPNSVAGVSLYDAPQDPRNLDKVHFFPGSFAAEDDLWNVFSVTTVTPDVESVSEAQNYSSTVVDIGVPADESEDNGFFNPRDPSAYVFGSSFATPKLTGMMAANYDLIRGLRNKQDIIFKLKQQLLLGNVPAQVLVKRAIMK